MVSILAQMLPLLAALLLCLGASASASASPAAPAAHPSCGVGTDSFPGCLRKPPMGWMSWEIFRCDVNCDEKPDACINHALYEQMTDRIVADGYLAKGYDQVTERSQPPPLLARCAAQRPLLTGRASR